MPHEDYTVHLTDEVGDMLRAAIGADYRLGGSHITVTRGVYSALKAIVAHVDAVSGTRATMPGPTGVVGVSVVPEAGRDA